MKSAAPSRVAATAFWMLPWPEIIDHADLGPLGLDAAEQLDAVDVGHPDVEQDQRRILARNQVHHAGGVAGVEHAKALVTQNSPQRRPNPLLIIHHQYGLVHYFPCAQKKARADWIEWLRQSA